MNVFDDISAAERQTECQHLWILMDDKTVICYDCGKKKERKCAAQQ